MAKMTISRLAAAASALIAAVLTASCAGAQTLQELYDKAKGERELVFYSGGPAAPHESRAQLFMQQYPGITVKITGGFSNVLNAKVEEQIKAGRVAALALADSTPLQGGIPIRFDGKVIGAIGVSGDTPQVDEAIAIAGARAFK